MLHDLAEKIADAETVQEYNRAVKELADYLRDTGKPDKVQKLTEIAALRNNRFSKREAGRRSCCSKGFCYWILQTAADGH